MLPKPDITMTAHHKERLESPDSSWFGAVTQTKFLKSKASVKSVSIRLGMYLQKQIA